MASLRHERNFFEFSVNGKIHFLNLDQIIIAYTHEGENRITVDTPAHNSLGATFDVVGEDAKRLLDILKSQSHLIPRQV